MPFFLKVPVQPWYFDVDVLNLFGCSVPLLGDVDGAEDDLQVLGPGGHVCLGGPGVSVVEVDRLVVGV